jgi:hypothetical protein
MQVHESKVCSDTFIRIWMCSYVFTWFVGPLPVFLLQGETVEWEGHSDPEQ